MKANSLELLRCVNCFSDDDLINNKVNINCTNCNQAFPIVNGVPFFFKVEDLNYWINLDSDHDEKIRRKKKSKNRLGSNYHWIEYNIKDYIPKISGFKRVLLLGCGDGEDVKIFRELGFDTTAFDVKRSDHTDLLADAHFLPFKNQTFYLVFSMQVLEHVHSPWVVVQEVFRVTKKGGFFVGSVAFLKPFHNSYFHITHLGMTSLLENSGFKVKRVSGRQNVFYNIFGSILPLGTHKMTKYIYKLIGFIVFEIRALVWFLKTNISTSKKTYRFNTASPMSYRKYYKMKFAPSIIFKSKK
jgi:SAM-dependent methyltransferase